MARQHLTIDNIAVIGAGTMGSGIAQVLLQSGMGVLLHDADQMVLKRASDTIAERLRRHSGKGRLDPDACDRALAAFRTTEDFAALSAADMVIEVVPERLDLKIETFAHLGGTTTPDAILASNTSGLDIAALGRAAGRPDKVVGMHFFNPPPVMPLVEVVRSVDTSETTFTAVITLAEKLGKIPIPVANSPGFAANRILFPMINEAIYALHEGVASAADIDRVLELGASHPLGPLALADFVGLDVTLDILASFEERFQNPKYRPCQLLREMVERGDLGRKSGRGFFDYS